ncbi:MAG TPA: RpiB/LacA/LacB family sugar-phosphate isomerase [Trebonia sp.]|nr:RpiB/LacA/LacB family sugar-phosphate isomerase [Trebonia sp.]
MSPQDGWRIVVGSDDAGWEYKELIKADYEADPRVAEVIDLGVRRGEPTAYSEIGLEAGRLIASGGADRGVLICGTGIGMAISANKVPGVRATTAHDSYSCERSVLSNDCQILTMGQRVIGAELARRLAREWLGYVFDPSSASNAKVAVITRFEQAAGKNA